MIGQSVRREASFSGPNRWQDRSDIAASKAVSSSAWRACAFGPSSIQTTAEEGRPSRSGSGTSVKGPPVRWISVERLPWGIGWVTAKASAFWPKRVVRTPMPAA